MSVSTIYCCVLHGQVKLHERGERGSGVPFYSAVLDEQGGHRRLAVKRMPWDTINSKLGTVREVSSALGNFLLLRLLWLLSDFVWSLISLMYCMFASNLILPFVFFFCDYAAVDTEPIARNRVFDEDARPGTPQRCRSGGGVR